MTEAAYSAALSSTVHLKMPFLPDFVPRPRSATSDDWPRGQMASMPTVLEVCATLTRESIAPHAASTQPCTFCDDVVSSKPAAAAGPCGMGTTASTV